MLRVLVLQSQFLIADQSQASESDQEITWRRRFVTRNHNWKECWASNLVFRCWLLMSKPNTKDLSEAWVELRAACLVYKISIKSSSCLWHPWTRSTCACRHLVPARLWLSWTCSSFWIVRRLLPKEANADEMMSTYGLKYSVHWPEACQYIERGRWCTSMCCMMIVLQGRPLTLHKLLSSCSLQISEQCP